MEKLNGGNNPFMDWESNDLPGSFKKFKEHAQFMFSGPLEKKSEESKCSYVMLWTGEKGRNIFSTWTLSDAEKKLLKTYWDKFEEYCKPQSNVIYNRYKFKSITQKDGEPFEQFVRYKCSMYDHFSKVCKAKGINSVDENQDISGNSCSESSDDNFGIYTVNNFNDSDQAYVNLCINDSQEIRFKIDSGSQCNILPNEIFKKLKLKHPLLPPKSKLTSYTGNALPIIGRIKLPCKYKDKSTKAEFYIVDSNAPPLISLNLSLELGLIKMTYSLEKQPEIGLDLQTVLAKNKDLFKGIGLLPGTCSLHLKENATPVVCPPRRVPFGLRERLKSE